MKRTIDKNSFLVVQYRCCSGARLKLAYAITLSFPSCHCSSSVPIAKSSASVSKINKFVEFDSVKTGVVVNA